MFQMGADIVKIFPAGTLGSKYMSDLQAPLNAMPLMAVGGVNADNCQEFFDNRRPMWYWFWHFSPQNILSMDDAGIKADIDAFEKKVCW